MIPFMGSGDQDNNGAITDSLRFVYFSSCNKITPSIDLLTVPASHHRLAWD
jgi:hypothetical protein